MTIRKLPGSQIESNTITITQIQTTAVTNIVTQAGPRVSSLIYPGNDTAGNTVGGQTVYINGSGFETNNAIYINGNAVPSKSFISASNLSFTTPALAAGIYPVYIINTDSGATAIFIPGYISSAEPAWVTSAGSLTESQDELSAWSYSLSATGDAPITYALAAGSSLPTGVSLAANGLISGTITSPSGNTTTYTFSVVATDAQNQDSTRQFTVTTTTGEGVLFANNVLLIHADGTNNQNNHTFLDSSNNNFTITRNGNATQGSFSPFSQTGWSGYFDGNGDYLSVADNAALQMDTSNFTMEAWVYPVSASHLSIFSKGTGGSSGFTFFVFSDQSLRFTHGASTTVTSSINLSLNTWSHVAAVREGTGANQFKLYINGVSVATSTVATNLNQTNIFYISLGRDGAGGLSFNGYISNARILKGTALYTTNFTPTTSPLTNIANTSLLTLQSNRFIDNSNNNFAITRNGDVSIQAFSPFAPTAAYSTANVGGSGYFDGTGDYLSIPANTAFTFGTNDFTVEGWFYLTTSANSYRAIFANPHSSGLLLVRFGDTTSYNGLFQVSIITSSASNVYSINKSQSQLCGGWHHFAFTRSGSTCRVFLDGIQENVGSGTNVNSFPNASFSDSTSITSSTSPEVGRNTDAATNFIGYISNLRVLKGTALYTGSTYTVPTAPLTNIANTSLLCNFTNAGIFDQTAKNILETVGDAKVSTAQYKYGTGSIVFDGTGDYLITPNNPLWIMSGDWTIEAWIYPANVTGVHVVVDTRNRTQSVTSPVMYTNGTSLVIDTGAGVVVSAGTITVNTWQHVAATRSANSWRLFINGTQVGNTTNNTTAYSVAYGCCIGTSYFNEHFNGYIDDLRITKGYARYTSNFTPPTAALKDK